MKKRRKKRKAKSDPELEFKNSHFLALLAVLTLACYFNSLRGDFVFDDWSMIVYNQKIRSIEHVPQYFTAGVWDSSQLEFKDRTLYRPFYLLSVFSTFTIWGLDPLGFHLVNVILHWLNSFLVFFVLRKLLPAEGVLPPLLAGLVFLAHPVHTESVSWISGIPDLLLTFFLLISFVFYIEHHHSKRRVLFAGALGFFVFALLSKEVAVVYPLLLVAYDYLGTRKIHPYKIGAFVLTAVMYLAVRRSALGASLGTLSYSPTGVARLFAFPAGYIRLLLAPWPIYYYFKTPIGSVVGIWGALLAACALIAALVYAAKTRGLSVFGLSWILITLLPPLSLAFLPEPAYGSFANRFLYLPSVGFSIFAADVAARCLKKYSERVVFGFFAYAVVLGLITVWVNRDWRTDGTFFSKALKYNPNHFGSHFNLAGFEERTGRTKEAIHHYLRALECEAPTRDKVATLNNLAGLYGKMGRADESILYYEESLKLDPENSTAHNGLGNNYYLRKEYEKALRYYQKAYEFDESNHEALYNVAMTMEKTGNADEARAFYRKFLERAPDAEFAAVKNKVRAKLAGKR